MPRYAAPVCAPVCSLACSLGCVLVLLLALLLSVVPVRAETLRAVFFPDAAEMTERETLPLAGNPARPLAVLLLPIQADPATLAVNPPKGFTVADITWERKDHVRQGLGKVLSDQLAALKKKRAGVEAKVAAANTRLEYWKGHGTSPARTSAEALQLAQALSSDVERTSNDKYDLDRSMEDLNREIAALEARLARTAGPEDAAWAVSVFLGPTPAKSAELTWSYRLAGCGWRPISRLDARPAEGLVHFSSEAEIWQSTGAALAQAEVALATLPRAVNTEPPALPEWIIQPRPEVQQMAKSRPPAPMMAVGAMADNAIAPAPAPAFAQHGTVGLWDLGRREVPAGEKIRLTLSETAWKATFAWVLRPSLDSRAFLRAEIKLPDPVDLPPAQALFLVDGAMLAKRPFALSGSEATLFFGPDPLITAKERLLDKKSGEAGVIGKKQTHAWDYEIEVVSAKAQAVPVVVETPRPLSRDQRIEISVTAEPKPEPATPEDENLLVWKLEPKPGQKTKITLQVRATAPADMKVDTGRR